MIPLEEALLPCTYAHTHIYTPRAGFCAAFTVTGTPPLNFALQRLPQLHLVCDGCFGSRVVQGGTTLEGAAGPSARVSMLQGQPLL